VNSALAAAGRILALTGSQVTDIMTHLHFYQWVAMLAW
jgi:hypothetical protein